MDEIIPLAGQTNTNTLHRCSLCHFLHRRIITKTPVTTIEHPTLTPFELQGTPNGTDSSNYYRTAVENAIRTKPPCLLGQI